MLRSINGDRGITINGRKVVASSEGALLTVALVVVLAVAELYTIHLYNAAVAEVHHQEAEVALWKIKKNSGACTVPGMGGEVPSTPNPEGGEEGAGGIDGPPKLVGSDLVQAGGAGQDRLHPGEEGWVYNLERVPSRTANTVYDPKEDVALLETHKKQFPNNRYGWSPVPKGSWKVRVGPNKFITMDEVAFAYDVWFEENQVFQYTSWMGVFIQQDPSDAFAIQDMLWRVKPDLIIEIGSNTGGGAIFYATIMRAYNPNGKIVTLDVKDISNWNKRNNHRCVGCVLGTEHTFWNSTGSDALDAAAAAGGVVDEAAKMIHFIKGRVTTKEVQNRIEQEFVSKAKTVLVIEDASHQYPATLHNVEASYRWVTPGSYLLVQDTKMDRFVGGLGKKYGNLKFGPMRSVDEFVAKHGDKFVVDRRFEYLLYSQHHRGFLRRKADP